MDEGYGDDDNPDPDSNHARSSKHAQPNDNEPASNNHEFREREHEHDPHDHETADADDTSSPKMPSETAYKTTPFRFKSHRKRNSPEDIDKDLRPHRFSHKYHPHSCDNSPHHRHDPHHRRYRHNREHTHTRHRSKRHKHSKDNEEGKKSDTKEQAHPDPRMTSANFNTDPPELDPDTAFRESLFDALADDEGADYWHYVYGQPIHTYSRTKVSSDGNGNGMLEEMTEDEYIAYVRRSMWEKSHEGREEARKQRAREREEEEKQQNREQGRRRTRNQRSAFNSKSSKSSYYDPEDTNPKNGGYSYLFDPDELIDDALKRGAERKQDKRRKEAWLRYLKAWDELISSSTSASTSNNDREKPKIPWPTPTLTARDISKETVKTFFEHASTVPIPLSSSSTSTASSKSSSRKSRVEIQEGGEEETKTESLSTILKRERVRWHPDKMQHRLGGAGGNDDNDNDGSSNLLDAETLKQITAVFQIVDSLYDEVKGKR